MLATVASLLVGAILLAAAGAKALDRTGSLVALSTYGIPSRWAAPARDLLIAAEAVAGAGLLAGWTPAAWLAAGLLAMFAAAQAVALATGRGGSPCGCLGARGRLSAASLARTATLLGLALTTLGGHGPAPVWAAAAAALVAVAAVRWGARPTGALDVTGEGPPVGARSALADHLPPPPAGAPGGVRLVVFTSEGCHLCRRLKPALAGLATRADVHVLDEERHAAAWLAANVPGSPFAVVLDPDGVVRAKGTVNSRRQLESLLAAAGARPPGVEDGIRFGRRGLLRIGAGAAGALTVSRLVRPGQAEAYHFCGHIYTTDSCPHPTGLPRVDAKGMPLRASDGRPVDDLGRLIDAAGRPVDQDGALLTDADGRPLPPFTRTAVCTATGRSYRIPVRVDGAWYRCCGGTVRKLVDCCSTHPRRINGDKALKGYCYRDRKVFCVMYFQTKVGC